MSKPGAELGAVGPANLIPQVSSLAQGYAMKTPRSQKCFINVIIRGF